MAAVRVRPGAARRERLRGVDPPRPPARTPEPVSPELVLVDPELARRLLREMDGAVAREDALARDDTLTRAEEAEAELARLRAELEEHTLRLGAAESALEERDRNLEELRQAHAERQHEIARLFGQLEERHAAIAELAAKLREQEPRAAATAAALEERDRRLHDLGLAREQTRRELEALAGQLEERERRLHDLGLAHEQAQRELEVLAGRLAERDAAVTDLASKLEQQASAVPVADEERPAPPVPEPSGRAAAGLRSSLALAGIGLLVGSAVTLAATRRGSEPAAERPPAPAKRSSRAPSLLTVPDVRAGTYARARRILAAAGFAWRVRGSVRGFASNLVAGQKPQPGTTVLDTGAPTIGLRLRRDPGVKRRGAASAGAPFTGTRIVLAGGSRSSAARKPPRDVRGLAADAGNGFVRLRWRLPADSDLDDVAVVRSGGRAGTAQKAIYRGRATSFVDRTVENGVAYGFLVTSYDVFGNRSPGAVVAAVPRAPVRRAARAVPRRADPVQPERRRRDTAAAPRAEAVPQVEAGPRGATVAPRLSWPRVPEATYYNFQLYRGGKRVLDFWPDGPPLTLFPRWAYGGRRYTLTPGRYQWFVWPGFGLRSQARYGKLLKSGVFTVAPREQR